MKMKHEIEFTRSWVKIVQTLKMTVAIKKKPKLPNVSFACGLCEYNYCLSFQEINFGAELKYLTYLAWYVWY